jgi:hypothetical protein
MRRKIELKPNNIMKNMKPEPDFFWSYLAHFGINSWKDIPLEEENPEKGEHWLTRCQADHVRFDEDSWKRVSAALAENGCNQIVIDIAEILKYPSHPELAVKGSWSVERFRAELSRLRGMGIEPIPKLNFSAGHDTWLKEYHRMVSTPDYYRVCEDVIRDVVEIFDRPRFFHLGYDEETLAAQRDCRYVVLRQGTMWWHDFLWFVKVTEKAGCRPWMWSDYAWHHKEEYRKYMPKSVLQSNWYYDKSFDSAMMGDKAFRITTYEWLDKEGFEQVPTGSNLRHATNFPDTVRFCDSHCNAGRIRGYMMATWARTFASHESKALDAARILGEVRKKRGSNLYC